jgi:hypothetical protein
LGIDQSPLGCFCGTTPSPRSASGELGISSTNSSSWNSYYFLLCYDQCVCGD